MSLLYLPATLLAIVTVLIAIGYLMRDPFAARGAVDALIVFGSSVSWRALSRCAQAAELFHAGRAREIVVSGGATVPWEEISEAEWFRDRLLRAGVPSESIVLETASSSTLENVAFARPLIETHRYRSVGLVSSDYLGLYVRYLVVRLWRNLNVDVFSAHAPSTDHWSPWGWWTSIEGWRLTLESLSRCRRARSILRASVVGRVTT